MYNIGISNRQEFKEYCLRKLGAPVTEINVENTQVEDRINDALERFWEFHEEGSVLVPLKITLTQEDIDSGIVEIPDEVMSIKNMVSAQNGAGTLGTNLQYHQYITEVLDIRDMHKGNLSSYVQNMSYLGTLNEILNGGSRMIEFNQHQGKVRIVGGLRDFKIGDAIVFEAYVIQNPEEYKKTWNNQWLKKYATALIKEQWGQNLIKLSGSQLPGNMVLNGDKILEDGKAEVERLEEELKTTWQEPPLFFMG